MHAKKALSQRACSQPHAARAPAAIHEAVQEKLAANAVARQVRVRGSTALLTGRLFDDRGNRMSPTHANKKGAR
jgi:site-specific DNA recombinase